jgi:hypothetical protein
VQPNALIFCFTLKASEKIFIHSSFSKFMSSVHVRIFLNILRSIILLASITSSCVTALPSQSQRSYLVMLMVSACTVRPSLLLARHVSRSLLLCLSWLAALLRYSFDYFPERLCFFVCGHISRLY